MTDITHPNSILVRAPVTMNIGPIPADLKSSSQIMTFGLQNFARILSEKGIDADVDARCALGTFSMDGVGAATQTTDGVRVDQRVYRLQPEGDQHRLEISVDLGANFDFAGNFASYDFARTIGDAWQEGRIEKAGA